MTSYLGTTTVSPNSFYTVTFAPTQQQQQQTYKGKSQSNGASNSNTVINHPNKTQTEADTNKTPRQRHKGTKAGSFAKHRDSVLALGVQHVAPGAGASGRETHGENANKHKHCLHRDELPGKKHTTNTMREHSTPTNNTTTNDKHATI